MTIKELIAAVMSLGTKVEAIETKLSVETPEPKETQETVEGAEASLSDLTARVDAVEKAQADASADFESKLEAAITEKTAELEKDFEAKVEEKAIQLEADRLAASGAPALQTGPRTEDDKAALSGLKGRAKVAAIIKSERGAQA
jgi:predicted nuclease with TOPRIM domain